jgi:hypothetical protein
MPQLLVDWCLNVIFLLIFLIKSAIDGWLSVTHDKQDSFSLFLFFYLFSVGPSSTYMKRIDNFSI